MTYRSLMCAQHPSLEKGDDPVSAGEKVVLGLPSLDLPVVDMGLQAEISGQPVGANGATFLHAVLNKPVEALPANIRRPLQPDAPDAGAIGFGRNQDDGFDHRKASYRTLFIPAPIGLIHFDRPAKAVPSRAHHRPAKLVEHGPCAPVAAKPKHPLQPQSADPRLLTCDIPHRPEPCREGQMRVLENRPREHGHLSSALPAQVQPVFHGPILATTTPWTLEAVWPPQGGKVLSALPFVAESLLQFHHRPWITFFHAPTLQVGGG